MRTFMTCFHFERSLGFWIAEVVTTNAGVASFCELVVLGFTICFLNHFLPFHSDPLIVLDDQKSPKLCLCNIVVSQQFQSTFARNQYCMHYTKVSYIYIGKLLSKLELIEWCKCWEPWLARVSSKWGKLLEL